VKYREYSYTSRWADGSLHTDTVYVPIGPFPADTHRNDDRMGYYVQDYPSEHLAIMLDRKWAAAYLRIRRLAGTPLDDPRIAALTPLSHEGGLQYNNPATGDHELRIHEGWLTRRVTDSVPNMPVDEYARPDTVVLHGEGMRSWYGHSYGETVEGTAYQEQRLDAGPYDDFHAGQECDEHGTDVPCTECGHNALMPCPEDCTCDQYNLDCEQCQAMYDCEVGNCDCITKLEQCSICDRDLGDGDTAWLCLDGGEYVCPDHIVHDERPDELFRKVGSPRGTLLPAFAWPGGYTLVYYTHDTQQLCAECASKVDTSDPAVTADADEEMNCVACEHAQSFHVSEKAHRTDGNSDDVGPCEYGHDGPDNDEVWHACNCVGYMPPLCDDCSKTLDPALRAWWAALTAKVTA